jgi:hypothetical protein
MLEQWVKQVAAQIEAAKMEGDKEINLDNLKTALTRDAVKIRSQERMAYGSTQPAPQVATPAFEPPGLAPDGMAFQR